MAGRFYTIPIANTAQTAGTGVSSTAIDLAEITVPSTKVMIVHEVVISQYSDFGDAASEGIGVVFKRAVGSTSGSFGQSVTPVKHQTGDAAAGITAEICNTTQLTGGTITILRTEAFQEQAGYQYLPTPEERYTFAPSEVFVVSLAGTLADAITVQGFITVEEIG